MPRRTRSTIPPIRRATVALLTTTFLLAAVVPAASANVAEEIGDGAFEALILRPFGFVASVTGCLAFLPAALLTLPTGRDSVDDAYRQFVIEPGEYVYKRPWGDF